MAISNKTGAMVVTTGNKSEMSVGYATLYGDMNGGFNPVKDLYKTEVFRLSRLRNAWRPEGALGPDGEVIPENIIVKPPTAELRENQKDQDSLPPYDMLDQILERLVEREEPIATIVASGFDRDIVLKVGRLLDLAEYKRRQAAPGGRGGGGRGGVGEGGRGGGGGAGVGGGLGGGGGGGRRRCLAGWSCGPRGCGAPSVSAPRVWSSRYKKRVYSYNCCLKF